MTSFAKALYQHAIIVHHIAHDYKDNASVADIRKDHPELDFLDSDEIQIMLIQAKQWRRKSTAEQEHLLQAMTVSKNRPSNVK